MYASSATYYDYVINQPQATSRYMNELLVRKEMHIH